MEEQNDIVDEDKKLVNEADDDVGDDAPAEDTPSDDAPPEDASDAGGDEGSDDSSSGEDAGSPEEGEAGEDAPAPEEEKPQNDEFSGLAVVKCACFGYTYPKSKSWVNLAQAVDDKGWSNVDQSQIESSLMHNVEQCYYSIVSFIFSNANDDMKYKLWFDNSKTMWKVEILNSPHAEMTIEQRAAFFKSPLVNKAAKQAWHTLLNAKKAYYKTLSRHLEEGELLAVDVVKLGAIMHFLDLQHFLNNVRDLKYINY